MGFTNKVVVVTGAASGIGAAAARHLSSLGAKVVLADRNEDELNKSAENCKGEVLQIVSDVNVEVDREKIINETIKKFGKIDVLVNNAGIGELGPTETFSMDKFDSVMNTNVRSVFRLTQLAIPHLIKSKGNIVNISSLAGLRAFAGSAVYCMSKAAVDQFTRCIALEFAPQGVRVNAINPGFIHTNFFNRMGIEGEMYNGIRSRATETHPLGRIGTLEETSQAIAFLANNEASSFITGTSLAVDGGKAIACPR